MEKLHSSHLYYSFVVRLQYTAYHNIYISCSFPMKVCYFLRDGDLLKKGHLKILHTIILKVFIIKISQVSLSYKSLE